jgi:hypothetical protein
MLKIDNMADESTFRGTLGFFNKLGIYDVILPFLLVFTIMFAILEKTKVLGTEKVDGEMMSKKNINAMVAFVIAFISVASTQIVAIINQTASQVVILLLLSIFFMILVGSFWQESQKPIFLDKGWNIIFMIIMFVGIILIFLNAITYNGRSWLGIGWYYLLSINNYEFVSSLILILVVIGFMWYITSTPKVTKS